MTLKGFRAFGRTLVPRQKDTSAEEVILGLYSQLNPEMLGYGADVHSPGDPAHWPAAYALLTSSSLALYDRSASHTYLQQALVCGDWLAENVGCSSTQAPCWGVPYSRMIWEDAGPTLPNTAFAIPTCHAIQALDEAASLVGDEARARKFRIAASRAAEYFAENCCDENADELAIWYSPLERHSFHVTNAISMMAGQFQRASRFASKGDLLADRADRAVRYLLRRCVAGAAGPSWYYFGDKIPSGKSNKKNDLLHEAFVCHGLIEYKGNGGRLSDEIDDDELLASLGKFYRDGSFYDFPEDESVKSRTLAPARATGLGHALYVASRLRGRARRLNLMSKDICDTIRREYVVQNELYHRPGGPKVSSFVRDVAHVLFGLSEYVRHHENRLPQGPKS